MNVVRTPTGDLFFDCLPGNLMNRTNGSFLFRVFLQPGNPALQFHTPLFYNRSFRFLAPEYPSPFNPFTAKAIL
jgi:hypothetical protein